MKRSTVASFSVLVLLAGLAIGTPSAAGSAPAAEAILLSPEEALAQDLAVTAKGHGWTVAEAEARYRTAEIIGEIAHRVNAERPDIFVGSALSTDPRGAPTLYIKGPADSFVRDLVNASGIEVVLADNQPFSFVELDAREQQLHAALRAIGFRNIVTEVDVAGGGSIPAWVSTEPGLSPSPEQVRSSLPLGLRDSVKLTVSDEPVAVNTSAFGGMWTQSPGGGNWSTSGFSVLQNGTGVPGVTTAAHGNPIEPNAIVHPGDATHSFVFQSEHRGTWGDVQWHTTNTGEPDDYYSSATTIADVVSIEAWDAISVGEGVCFFGRVTGQNCSLDVVTNSASCTVDNIWYGHMVRMDGITSDFGDSGGPWFSAGRAYGGQKGQCGGGDTFSVADRFDEAIGVTVRLN